MWFSFVKCNLDVFFSVFNKKIINNVYISFDRNYFKWIANNNKHAKTNVLKIMSRFFIIFIEHS